MIDAIKHPREERGIPDDLPYVQVGYRTENKEEGAVRTLIVEETMVPPNFTRPRTGRTGDTLYVKMKGCVTKKRYSVSLPMKVN
jgi:hypothetical protein